MEIIVKARLVNLTHPTLVFDRKYFDEKIIRKNVPCVVEFLNLDQDIEVIGHAFLHNNKTALSIGTKVKGCLGLSYQTDYEIRISVKSE